MQKIVLAFVIALINAIVVRAEPVPLNTRVMADPIITERGSEVMRLKSIGTVIEGTPFSTWNFPTSIIVNGNSYVVNHNRGAFEICPQTNSTFRIITGVVVRVNDYHTAVQCGLGALCTNNKNVWSAAKAVNTTRLTVGGNVLYHACQSGGNRTENVLICKNVYVRAKSYSITNNFDFAMSLLNAGLPESERLPPLQAQH